MKTDVKKIEREYKAPIPINQLLAHLTLKINFYQTFDQLIGSSRSGRGGVGGSYIHYFIS